MTKEDPAQVIPEANVVPIPQVTEYLDYIKFVNFIFQSPQEQNLARADVNEALECPICMDNGINRVTQCGHAFCVRCMDRVIDRRRQLLLGRHPQIPFNLNQVPCPSCRLPIRAVIPIFFN